ncbi:hypothetical protein ACIGO9_28640 [Nocardia asteroides]|uniref:hypothetical protein n=1 Tax=Nocardia asteroides TaxID=1824 RepID=UPI0037C6CDF7
MFEIVSVPRDGATHHCSMSVPVKHWRDSPKCGVVTEVGLSSATFDELQANMVAGAPNFGGTLCAQHVDMLRRVYEKLECKTAPSRIHE